MRYITLVTLITLLTLLTLGSLPEFDYGGKQWEDWKDYFYNIDPAPKFYTGMMVVKTPLGSHKAWGDAVRPLGRYLSLSLSLSLLHAMLCSRW